MTRLFLRFYVGVICILFISMLATAYAFHRWLDADFDHIKAKAMGENLSRVRGKLKTMTGDEATAAAQELQSQFDYPVRVISEDHALATVQEWLAKGDDVVVHVGNELSVLTPIGTRTEALRFGPVALQQGVIETNMKLGLGAMLLLVALAIAVLLRPLARQLSVLEQTAIAIAGGNLSARVDERRVDSAKTLAQAFNVMAARTEAMLRTQRELLQAVSHELRTPLTRIHFAIDLIRGACDDHERDSRLDSLDTAAQELDELVGELLEYVRLETSGPPTVCESVELLSLVEELIEKESLVRQTIRFEIGPELERGNVCVIADRTGLTRVLSNLIGNAIRFARQRVVVNATSSSVGTTIEVDDDGPGIPSSDRERVFDPFVRLEETSRGTGLGLALVKRIVTNHGGTVAALSNPLNGCRIRSFWPVHPLGCEEKRQTDHISKGPCIDR